MKVWDPFGGIILLAGHTSYHAAFFLGSWFVVQNRVLSDEGFEFCTVHVLNSPLDLPSPTSTHKID